MRPYHSIPIWECGEPLRALPEDIPRCIPHVYQALGAPYAGVSPFDLRVGVVTRLLQAQSWLDHQQSGLRIQVFDGLRPLAVQHFMVEWTFAQELARTDYDPEQLTDHQRSEIYGRVYQFWAEPRADLTPPHSTGAAIDVTLIDQTGQPLDMGSPIDEVSERSFPDHFEPDGTGALFHQRRKLLYDAMRSAGFERHPQEWWHFSYGDQFWAWLTGATYAFYGKA